MNEVRTLFENFWICKNSDKETYYKVKRDIPNFQKFIREQLGWKLIHTENLLKLEKKPAHARSFMGISGFTDIRDYCILCVALMYLEDKEEQEQFLLSELIDYVETQLKSYMDIDWTSFTQRKSLVRVLQYMEKLKMLKVYEGSSEAFGTEAGRRFCMKIPGIQNILKENADALYLKNQRQWIEKYLNENLGGNLDVYKNAAFLTLDEDDCYGAVHPRDAMLPEAVMLICAKIQRELAEGKLEKKDNEHIYMTRSNFTEIVLDCRKKWSNAWSKEFREMDEEKLLETILEYMKSWMMLRCDGEELTVLPAVGRITGYYPKDFKGGTKP